MVGSAGSSVASAERQSREDQMRVFEIVIVESAVRTGGGPFVPRSRLSYWLPDEAEETLRPILGPYGQDPMWYFDTLKSGSSQAPWALACLDREYGIAGHVATSRPPDAGVLFAPYRHMQSPMPDDFVPGVGLLTFAGKSGLESAAAKSPLFAAAWDALRECSSDRRWLVILDPPSKQWLDQATTGDRERWLLARGR
jgi:hypothetical protein